MQDACSDIHWVGGQDGWANSPGGHTRANTDRSHSLEAPRLRHVDESLVTEVGGTQVRAQRRCPPPGQQHGLGSTSQERGRLHGLARRTRLGSRLCGGTCQPLELWDPGGPAGQVPSAGLRGAVGPRAGAAGGGRGWKAGLPWARAQGKGSCPSRAGWLSESWPLQREHRGCPATG